LTTIQLCHRMHFHVPP